jgi:hypothetical protein
MEKPFKLGDERTDLGHTRELAMLVNEPSIRVKNSDFYDYVYNLFKIRKEEIKQEIDIERDNDLQGKNRT